MALRFVVVLRAFVRAKLSGQACERELIAAFEEQEFARAAHLGFQPIAVRVRDDR